MVKVQSHYHIRVPADRSFVSVRNIRYGNDSYLIRSRPYMCGSVRIYAYRVRMAFSNVFYVSTLIFRPCLNFDSFQKLHVYQT